jgi:hypothetical protein
VAGRGLVGFTGCKSARFWGAVLVLGGGSACRKVVDGVLGGVWPYMCSIRCARLCLLAVPVGGVAVLLIKQPAGGVGCWWSSSSAVAGCQQGKGSVLLDGQGWWLWCGADAAEIVVLRVAARQQLAAVTHCRL